MVLWEQRAGAQPRPLPIAQTSIFGGRTRRCCSRARGFSLVEVSITVAILALAAAVVVPAISNVSRAELREAAAKLSGTLRATYDEAALTGRPYRLVLSPGKSTVKVEAGEPAMHSNTGGLAALTGLLGGPAAATESDDAAEVQPPPEIVAFFGGHLDDYDSDKGAAAGAESDGLTKYQKTDLDLTFDDSVKVLDVWIDGMQQPASEGTVYLPFFSNGYTQDAMIHLTNTEGHVFTVSVAALTGKTTITGEYVEVPK